MPKKYVTKICNKKRLTINGGLGPLAMVSKIIGIRIFEKNINYLGCGVKRKREKVLSPPRSSHE